MTEPTPDQIANFIAGLSQLSQETGVTIEGCGCCGSPTLWAKPPGLGGYEYDADGLGPDVFWVKVPDTEQVAP